MKHLDAMKYFRGNNFLYGITYTVRRGYEKIRSYVGTIIHRNAVARCGKGVKFGANVFILYPKNIKIGNNVYFGDNVIITAENDKASLTIGDNVQISRNVEIDYTGSITIESDVLISPFVKIVTHDHGYYPHSIPKGRSLIIRKGAWLGMGCLIMHGTREIGEKSIVGAACVVTKRVPAGNVIYGNRIKKRNDI